MAEQLTKSCPFCFAEIPAGARKCQHCGEWVDRPPTQHPPSRPDDSLGHAANNYVNYQIVMSIIGLIVFLIVLFTVILPRMNQNGPAPLNLPSNFVRP